MKVLRDMKIGTKLLIAFSVLVILFAVGLCSAMMGLSAMSDDIAQLYQREFGIVQICKEMQRDIQALAKDISRTLTAAVNVEERNEISKEKYLDERIATTRATLDDIKANIDILEGYQFDDGDYLSVISDNYPELLRLANIILEDYDTGKIAEGVTLTLGSLDDCAKKIGMAADALSKGADLRAIAKYENTQSLFDKTQLTSYIIGIALIIASAALCVTLTRGITHPLKMMEAVAMNLTKGNLKQDIKYESKNEFGSLARSMSETMDALRLYIGEAQTCMENIGKGKLNYRSELDFKGDFIEIKHALDDISCNLTRTMRQINESASQVSEGAEQIASGAQSLSQATIEQASSIEEFSQTINDVSDRVRENAENAVIASRLSATLGSEVENSSVSVQALSGVMADMREMSARITGIIDEIKDIAFQTNILSLNAAVEAAKAGESGKGFSVVANEIRRLSTKTTDASKQTSELIGRTVQLMVNGSDMANDISEKLKLLVKSANDAVERSKAISTSSNDQASAVVQLRESIVQISAVVQENSSTAEESAEASE